MFNKGGPMVFCVCDYPGLYNLFLYPSCPIPDEASIKVLRYIFDEFNAFLFHI